MNIYYLLANDTVDDIIWYAIVIVQVVFNVNLFVDILG